MSNAKATTHDDEGSGQIVWLYQKQRKIYPRSVQGWFAAWRWALVLFTQLLFYGVAWIPWHGRQAVLFDLVSRRFFIFDLVLYPQDFIYLTGLLIISAYGLFLFTAVAGRFWCGYACPQTVYTEIFLWIERKVEGDRAARMRLDQGPWGFNRLWRKVAKHSLWLTLSLWTGFTFVGYFTPIRELFSEALQFSFGPWEWFWVLFYGFATYGNAGFMREQVCKYMCPYARFQSAMFDKDTLIISYDTARGDPRGARNRKINPKEVGLGDCVDCGLCVQVCPTGIDIRNGLQYECIGCAACVDVCNGVMDKMGYPRGLVRYATQNSMQQGWTRQQMWHRVTRPRVLIYFAVLVLITAGLATSLAMRSPFKFDVIRDRASLGRYVDDGAVENVYQLRVMNTTEAVQHYELRVEGLPGVGIVGAHRLEVLPAQAKAWPLAVQVSAPAAEQLGAGAHTMNFVVTRMAQDGQSASSVTEKASFMVPR